MEHSMPIGRYKISIFYLTIVVCCEFKYNCGRIQPYSYKQYS